VRSWSFWKRELKKRLLLGPENDGIGDTRGQRVRYLNWPRDGGARFKSMRFRGRRR
jgi:hypothetical protein